MGTPAFGTCGIQATRAPACVQDPRPAPPLNPHTPQAGLPSLLLRRFQTCSPGNPLCVSEGALHALLVCAQRRPSKRGAWPQRGVHPAPAGRPQQGCRGQGLGPHGVWPPPASQPVYQGCVPPMVPQEGCLFASWLHMGVAGWGGHGMGVTGWGSQESGAPALRVFAVRVGVGTLRGDAELCRRTKPRGALGHLHSTPHR